MLRHEISGIFPEMDKHEFENLCISIKTNGFDNAFPIILYEGKIVDGWHRYKAAQAVSINPVFKEWQGEKDKLRAFIIYANSTRRQLSKSAHVQSIIKSMVESGIKYENVDQAEVMRITGANQSQVSDQLNLRKKDYKIADEVAKGKIAANTAIRKTLRKEPDKHFHNASFEKHLHPFNKSDSEIMQTIALSYYGMTLKQYVNNAVKVQIERDLKTLKATRKNVKKILSEQLQEVA